MKSNPRLKVIVDWRPTAGEPSPLWRRLWTRLLLNKKGTPPEQAPGEDRLAGGAEEDSSHVSE